MMNRDELNKAIRKVLINQYKKDAKEAHQMVEDAGYEIYKIGGEWRVMNRRTDRAVYIGCFNRCSREYIFFGPRFKDKVENNKHFDFVGALEKPVNREYESSIACTADKPSKALQAYEQVQNARWYVQHKNEEIARIQEQMAKLQKDLIQAVEYKAQYEAELKQVKKAVGLR